MEKPTAKPNPENNNRYIINAKTPGYVAAIKKLYASGMTRAQVHKILDITKGNPIGLRVAKHVGVPKIWFTYRGYRYDVKPDGALVAEVKTGAARRNPPAQVARNVKCQLCGKEVPVAQFEVGARCPVCGFQLVKYNVVRRV